MSPIACHKCFVLLFVFSILFSFKPLLAQSPVPPLHGIFLEGRGSAPHYSINYMRRIFTTGQLVGYARVGGSVWGNGLAIPFGVSLLTGRSDHYLEVTLAVTPYSEGLRFWDRTSSDIMLDLISGLGYRYRPQSKLFFVGAGVFPYLHLDPTADAFSEEHAEFSFRPGLSMGWYLDK